MLRYGCGLAFCGRPGRFGLRRAVRGGHDAASGGMGLDAGCEELERGGGEEGGG